MPGKDSFATSPKYVQTEKPAPVILLMHGCIGIAMTEPAWAEFLKAKGYVVVLPNSFARNRPASCDPRSKRVGIFPGVVEFRLDEVRYALEKIMAAPWADKRNIFLMGHSEGGVVVANSDIAGFRGEIVSAWVCVSRSPKYTGVRAASDVPLLVLDHEQDDWYAYASGRHCSEFFTGRAKARQVVLPGSEHNTYAPEAQKAVVEFLEESSAR